MSFSQIIMIPETNISPDVITHSPNWVFMASSPTLGSELETDLHVVLVEPEIHTNTGNIGRLCLATGAQLHLVEPLGFDLEDRRVRRAGLDYWSRVRPVVWRDWSHFAEELEGLARFCLGFYAAESSRTYWDVSYTRPTVLVFGRESAGLPAELRERYEDRLVGVPMCPGSVRSLNLANCVGLALFEVLRQRREAERNEHVLHAPRRPGTEG